MLVINLYVLSSFMAYHLHSVSATGDILPARGVSVVVVVIVIERGSQPTQMIVNGLGSEFEESDHLLNPPQDGPVHAGELAFEKAPGLGETLLTLELLFSLPALQFCNLVGIVGCGVVINHVVVAFLTCRLRGRYPDPTSA